MPTVITVMIMIMIMTATEIMRVIMTFYELTLSTVWNKLKFIYQNVSKWSIFKIIFLQHVSFSTGPSFVNIAFVFELLCQVVKSFHPFQNKIYQIVIISIYHIYPCIIHTFFYKNNHQNCGAYYTQFLLFFKHILICIR